MSQGFSKKICIIKIWNKGRKFFDTVSRKHIEISSDVRSGKPCISDIRIAVEDVAMMHLKLGYSLIVIAGKYDLSLASVYAAMAYYFDRRDEIDRRTAEEDELVEVLKQNHSSRVEKHGSNS